MSDRGMKKIIDFFEKRAWLCWILTIIYMIIIFYISSLSYIPEPAVGKEVSDLFKHFLLYVGLGILFFISLKSSKIGKYAWLIAVLISILYGISDEIHQAFVPGRVCALEDVIANSLGSLFGSSIMSFLRKGFKGK